MVEEIKALQKNSNQKMVEFSQEKKIVRYKWMFLVNYKSYETIGKYKTRVVAKGYTLTYQIDSQETFALMAKINTIKFILSLAINLNQPLRQFDIKNVSLHGHMLEVHIDPPLGFTPKGGKVSKLKMALYGLKQLPRAQFGRLSYLMNGYGFKQIMVDHTLLYKRDVDDLTLLIVYIDDMIVRRSNFIKIGKLQSYLDKEFEMKDLGALKYFVGIEAS